MGKIQRPNCSICRIPGILDSRVYSDFSGITFNYLRCEDCGLGWISNPNSNFESLYDIQYYKGLGADSSVNYWEEMFSEKKDFNRKLRDIEYLGILKTLQKTQFQNVKKTSKHLDFGGGLGGLVRFLQSKEINSVLFEEGFSAKVAAEINIPIVQNLKDGIYDCVTAIEVLEHLIEPGTAAATMARALRSGGVLLITTGNLSKHKGLISDWYYAKNNPEVHVTFFTPKALSRLLKDFGLVQMDTKFDSNIILYKVLKNIFMQSFIKDRNLVKKVIWNFRWILFPLMPIVDRIYGVSQQGLYVKL